MQLIRATLIAAAILAPTVARAEDRVDVTTTWYQEQRAGGLGGLTVVHPQAAFGVGDRVTFDASYAADAVTGATAAVYSVDAVSSATKFDDLRHQGGLSFGLKGRRARLAISAGLGAERDYLSLSVGGDASIDLPGRNTTFALSYSHAFDEVCDRDNAMATPLERRALTGDDPCAKRSGVLGQDTPGTTVWHPIAIDTAQATVTQNLTPTMNAQASLYGQVLDGFQSNPYRRVRVGGVDAQEHTPEVRGRIALTVRLNRYLEALRGALHLDARAYSDTWGVNAGTLGVAFSKYAGSSLLLRVHGRLHQQTAATFFKDAFFYETESTAGEYFTGDRELSPVRNAVVGAKLTVLSVAEDDASVWGLFDAITFNLKGDLYLLSESPADDVDANLGGIDRQFLSSGQRLDAFVVQLGLLADY